VLRVNFSTAVVLAAACLGFEGKTGAAPGDLILVSVTKSGMKGNSASSLPSISADGTRIAFLSLSTNLDPADPDSIWDAYVKDMVTGDLILASTTKLGMKANKECLWAPISPDGTKVAFASSATNLDPRDTDPDPDVYIKDLITGDLVLASVRKDGVKANGGLHSTLSISADGTKVAFCSTATNLDPLDTDDRPDVYVKDTVTGDLTLASATISGTKGNRISTWMSLSADGTKVAFSSNSNLDPRVTTDRSDLFNIYIKDLITGDLTLASVTKAGTAGDGTHGWPSLSADGKRVTFYSYSTNLDPADSDT
jgi:Tol biopolymer transport system component